MTKKKTAHLTEDMLSTKVHSNEKFHNVTRYAMHPAALSQHLG